MTWLAVPENNAHRSTTGVADKSVRAHGQEGTLRILIVEDEFLIALELENRLLDAGFMVVGIAATAEEAIALARAERPDLAIADIRLAGRTDGVDTAIVLFDTLGLRSIFSSAHADDAETQNRAAVASPIGWLQKPYPASALIGLIKTHLRG